MQLTARKPQAGGDCSVLPRTITANRFQMPGVTFEFSPAEGGRPQAWHIVDGDGRRLLELPLVKFDMPKADLGVGDYVGTVRFLRDPKGSIAAFTLNRNSARGVRFERERVR